MDRMASMPNVTILHHHKMEKVTVEQNNDKSSYLKCVRKSYIALCSIYSNTSERYIKQPNNSYQQLILIILSELGGNTETTFNINSFNTYKYNIR